MSGAAAFFRVGAFLALLVLVRHAWRTEGWRPALILIGYLAGFACFREWFVARFTALRGDNPPYLPDPSLGHVGPVNVVVVAGWVFTALLSLALARMIQHRNFPGTNVFLTLVLATLVSTTVGYAVEVTGIRMGLWKWTHPRPTPWLPFHCPYEIFDAWGTTTFVTLGMYCAVRFRLFAGSALRRVAVFAAVLLVFWGAVLSMNWFGGEAPPHQKVVMLYLVLCTALGFTAPRWMLGSSETAATARTP